MAVNQIVVSIEDTGGLGALFKQYMDVGKHPGLPQAVLDAALVMEARIKQKLRDLVYETPKSLTYERTQDLLRHTQATGKVKKSKGGMSSAVVAAEDYAKYVEYGTEKPDGSQLMPPRPFMQMGSDEAEAEVVELLREFLSSI